MNMHEITGSVRQRAISKLDEIGKDLLRNEQDGSLESQVIKTFDFIISIIERRMELC